MYRRGDARTVESRLVLISPTIVLGADYVGLRVGSFRGEWLTFTCEQNEYIYLSARNDERSTISASLSRKTTRADDLEPWWWRAYLSSRTLRYSTPPSYRFRDGADELEAASPLPADSHPKTRPPPSRSNVLLPPVLLTSAVPSPGLFAIPKSYRAQVQLDCIFLSTIAWYAKLL